MKEKDLAELYMCLQAEMKTKLRTSRTAYDHSTTKGDSTETDWIGWLREYLPKRYCVDKAIVIDSENHVSDQIDIVIYDQQYSHPVFSYNGSKYVTAESVYAVFEVKQTLNKEYMKYAGEKIGSVRALKRTSTSINSANGVAAPKPLHKIVSGILTLESEWKDPILKNVVDNMTERFDLEQIDLVCSLEHGSFVAIYDPDDCNKIVDVIYSNKDESLLFLFLELLKKLQPIGTVPAIDINEYEKAITKYSNNEGD